MLNQEKILSQLNLAAVNSGAYSGYEWQHSHESKTVFASYNPSTEEEIATITSCSLDDYEQVMDRARADFLVWRRTPAPKRGEIIRQIGVMLREHKHTLGALISLEVGKSKQEGEGEVQEMIDMADFAVGQSRMLYGKTMHSERPLHRMYEQWLPLGIVGVISAFNFPLAVWAWNAFMAAICGNITVWKPAKKTPLCAIAIHQLIAKVLKDNHAPGIFSLIIPTSSEVRDAMVDDTRIRLLSFTGSTSVGRHVAARVASRLGRSLLELGGNNAVIIDESADLSVAIPGIVFGALGTAGQRCTSTRRLLVHINHYEDVLFRLKHAYAQIKLGDPLEGDYLMGPLIDAMAVQHYEEVLRRVQKEGGTIAYGGRVLDRRGYFVEPTLVIGLANHSAIVQEETFAPILYVQRFSTLEDAITIQNAVPQGLSSALFTQSLQHAEQYLSVEGSDCGIANINIGTSGAEIGGAFGGEKETGGGREAGSDAWKIYMRRQTNVINWGNELPLAQGIIFE